MASPDTEPIGYGWYRKLAEWMNKEPLGSDEYNKVPIDSWASMVGLSQGPVTKGIMEAGDAARLAAEKTDDIMQKQGSQFAPTSKSQFNPTPMTDAQKRKMLEGMMKEPRSTVPFRDQIQ